MAHSMQNIPRNTTFGYDTANVLSRRPAAWDLDTEVTTVILRGAAAHRNRSADGAMQGHFLIRVPGHLIQYLDHAPARIVVHNHEDDRQDVDPTYWPEIPFGEVPDHVMNLLMLTYTQFGYVR